MPRHAASDSDDVVARTFSEPMAAVIREMRKAKPTVAAVPVGRVVILTTDPAVSAPPSPTPPPAQVATEIASIRKQLLRMLDEVDDLLDEGE